MNRKDLLIMQLKSVFLTLVLVLSSGHLSAQEKTYTLQDINIRDPFILPVEKEGMYYMYASSSVRENGKHYGGMVAYKSADLKTWQGPVRVFDVPRDNYLTGTVWAPEVHKYKGKYYLFATLNTDINWKKAPEGATPYRHRCTQIFWSKKPEGPFLPFKEKLPATPIDQMALDGTLWVEDGVPYMVYCHEWVQVRDGGMNLVRL
ncbi:MAG: family 43 glycosylhydrolase, partial [Bacteroidaceae bacterium]|nr:family 43 glycosylhydrolase [Bacteroidaceae bacterium]